MDEAHGLGTRVKALRTERCWSQADLAGACRLDERTIRRIEKGEHRPTFETVQALAGALNVDVKELMPEEGKPKPRAR